MVICGKEGFDQLWGIHSHSIDLERPSFVGIEHRSCDRVILHCFRDIVWLLLVN